jgi:hypothetical protein
MTSEDEKKNVHIQQLKRKRSHSTTEEKTSTKRTKENTEKALLTFFSIPWGIKIKFLQRFFSKNQNFTGKTSQSFIVVFLPKNIRQPAICFSFQ